VSGAYSSSLETFLKHPQIDSLREIWKHEGHNFTQWLAMEDYISLLPDEIGVTAENIECWKIQC
jgi:hypothetical protein